MDRRKSVMEFSEHWQDLLTEGGFGWWRLTPPGYGGTCLPAGRSVRGSDTPPACHSTPRAHQGEGLAPAGGCSKKVHGFSAKLKGRIKESEYAIKQKER